MFNALVFKKREQYRSAVKGWQADVSIKFSDQYQYLYGKY